MKFKWNFIFKLILLASLVLQVSSTAVLMGGVPLGGNDKGHKYDRLKEIAWEKGMVRVMVKLDVPGIETLTALSTGFKTGITDESYIQAAYNADLALEHAIFLVGDTVLHRLNGCTYQVNRTFSTLPCLALSVTAETLEMLGNFPEVLDIMEDRLTRLPAAKLNGDNDDISRPFLYRSTIIIGADIAWGLGYTGAGWYVAILDTGILPTHEMFQGKNIIEQCYSLGDDWQDAAGSCPNGKTEMSGPGSAAHYAPQYGHGTHVSGIAAGNNHTNRFGVAKDADIIAVQVFSYFPVEHEVMSWNSDQAKGLEYVYTLRNRYKIAAANMSLGGDKYSGYCDNENMLTDAMNNLKAAGIATAVASGNESYCGFVGSPACISSAVTVNGTDKQDKEFRWGNWHDEIVDLMAPGEAITSAYSTGNFDYNVLSGTSMAAPHVAGAWAIMKQFDQSLGVDELLSLFQDTGLMIPSIKCTTGTTEPRINVGNALMTLLALAPPINLSVRQVLNQSFLQTEYINEITWESNPLNANKNVALYKIYVAQDSQLTPLAQVNSSTFKYLHRNAKGRQTVTYAVKAVDAGGQESLPIYYTLVITGND